MKEWAEFHPDVVPDVPGCAEPTVNHHLRRSAQRFMDETLAWREWLPAITTNGEFEQSLPLDASTLLVQILNATLDDAAIEVYAPDNVPAEWRSGSAFLDIGVFTLDGETLQLVPVQDTGLSLVLEVAMKPSNTARGVQNHIFNRYAEAIAHGAKASLLAMPGTAWSNPQLAGYCKTQFEEAIAKAASAIAHGHSRAPLRTKPSFL